MNFLSELYLLFIYLLYIKILLLLILHAKRNGNKIPRGINLNSIYVNN